MHYRLGLWAQSIINIPLLACYYVHVAAERFAALEVHTLFSPRQGWH